MDDEDLEAFGYAAGMKTKLPFATLQGAAHQHQYQNQQSDSSFGLLMRASLHEELVCFLSLDLSRPSRDLLLRTLGCGFYVN